eukprot:bmy_18997T0
MGVSGIELLEKRTVKHMWKIQNVQQKYRRKTLHVEKMFSCVVFDYETVKGEVFKKQYDGNDFFLPPELHGFFECAEREREKGGEDMRSQYVAFKGDFLFFLKVNLSCDLINLAKKRTNIIPVIEDAQHSHKYHKLIAMVDVIFADMAQPDQTQIVALNAHTFLCNGGHFVISVKPNCIDFTASPEAIFVSEGNGVKNIRSQVFTERSRLTEVDQNVNAHIISDDIF